MRYVCSVREYLNLDAATKRQNVDRALDDLARLLAEQDPSGDDPPVSQFFGAIFAIAGVLAIGAYALIGLLFVLG